MATFKFVSPEVWQISDTVRSARRARLLGKISFRQIVAMICDEASLAKVSRENEEETEVGLHRWVVTLHAHPTTIDFWHNSRGGYRAQYYIDPDFGDEANAYALDAIQPVVEKLVKGDRYRNHVWPRASKSVCHRHTRLWIGQGTWLRLCRIEDRVLHVARWQDHKAPSKRVAKLVRWGMLLPAAEKRLCLKGQWLNEDGSPTSEPPKPSRSRAHEISQYGFT